MRDEPTTTESAGVNDGSIGWDVDFGTHPLLAPDFLTHGSRLRRSLEQTYERIRADDFAYRRETARRLQPARESDTDQPASHDFVVRMTEYLREADVYVCSAANLLPDRAHDHARPLREVVECHDLRELLGLALEGRTPRLSYEALRKIYLAQLLIDIEHSRRIQDGPRHLAYFESLLQQALWRYTRQAHELVIGFHVDDDGETINYTSRPGPDDSLWQFQSIYLEKPDAGRNVCLDILYHSCRFKRSVSSLSYVEIGGQRRVTEKLRWGRMRQVSTGSILSKMIRKGIDDPDEIADLLGAKFIVHDEEAADDLLSLLDADLGGPFGWRNVTDTLGAVPEGSQLNRHSGKGFRVFKGDVGILYPGRSNEQSPYLFGVEIQIHTLESYLRTVCSVHHASHLALKQRQFLHGLVPMIFPRAIYGGDWL